MGANTIKVQVTAEDGTTDTYTVVVTRAAAATPTVTISANKTSAVFKEDGITYTVTRTGSTTAALSVSVALTQTKNFLTNLTQTVTIGAGQSTGTFTISASDFQHFATGTKVEGGTLTATVQDILGYDPGTPSSVDVAIVIGVTIRIRTAAYSVGEGDGNAVLTVVARTGAGAPQPSASHYVRLQPANSTAQAPDDFDATAIAIEFAVSDFTRDGTAWESEKTAEIPIVDDALDEPDQTFLVNQLRPAGAFNSLDVDSMGNFCGVPSTCAATVTIVDNDAPIPEVTVADAAATVTSGGVPCRVTVTV